MQNYPTLKTSVPYLQLQPLQKKHIPFLVELLSNKTIQASLFRIPTKITPEKETKSIEKMYDGENPKEITYLLTIKKLFSEKYIGYVKIKLIDWDVKSCYLSVAILPSEEYRGKGYSKAAYDAFFTYLFSLGFMKIYGRTYETNIPTIKLNFATGFRFIGRQTDFILYPNKTSLDALFFEKLNPILETEYAKRYGTEVEKLAQVIEPLAHARTEHTVTEKLLIATKSALQNLDIDSLPSPFKELTHEVLTSVETELSINNFTESSETDDNALLVLRHIRQTNATKSGFKILSLPITREHLQHEKALLQTLIHFSDRQENIETVDIENAILYGTYTPQNWKFVYPLFLGKRATHSAIETLKKIMNAPAGK